MTILARIAVGLVSGFVASACATASGPAPFQSPNHPSLTGTTSFPPDLGRGAPRSESEVTMMYVPIEIQHFCSGVDPKFGYNAVGVQADDNHTLGILASCMTDGALKGKTLRLVGHADIRGSDAYNDRLGKSRAEAVKLFLVKAGVAPDRLVTVTDGKQGATSPPEDWDCRVDFEIAQ